jgi:hypothetical protein
MKNIFILKKTNEKVDDKKKNKKTKNYYFGNDVQEKIVEYQNETSNFKKERCYERHIHPAFTNLVNSLVAVYNFKSSNEEIEHLKSDCIVFLFENLHKWNPEKGTKAFSYFNVVAKNWLTIQSRRLLKHAKRSAYIDDEDGLTQQEKSEIFDRTYEDTSDEEEMYRLRFEKLFELMSFIEDHLKDDKDIRCCMAIKKLYSSIDDIEFFNKRAIFVYLREISGLNSTELSMSLSSIRKIYRKNVGENKKFDFTELM